MSDLVPTFTIETLLSEDGTKVSLRATAGFVNKSIYQPINTDSIHQLLTKDGYKRFRFDEEQISEISSALTEATEEIQTEEDAKGFSVETDPIAEAFDALAEVEVSEDKLQAILSITPAEGGKNITLVDAETLLDEQGVTYGINTTTIEELITKATTSPAQKICSAVAAEALMPVRGNDSEFIPLVDTANERILKPRILEDGTVDMLDLGDLPTVSNGTQLMRKEPPTEGEKGIDVLWGFIPAEPGTDLEYKPGAGTKISEDDELILLSTISGQPNLLKNGMKVDDAVQVKAVDLSTGHMKLDANLIVKGDIAEGMKVRCEGDITVGGVIESADVKAKGNIIIGKGILGRTPDHSKNENKLTVSIQAEGSISAMFASYALISAGEDILIAEQLLHCDTTSKGKILVGNDKTVGSQIVGGISKAAKSIETDILGASAGVFTQFDLSGPFNVKNYEVSCNRSIIDGKTTMLDNMRDAYSKFMNLQMTEARKVHMQKIKNTISFLENEITELEEQNLLLMEESEQLCHGLAVRAKRKIQPNVALKIGHSKYRTTRERESGELYYEGGEIRYQPNLGKK